MTPGETEARRKYFTLGTLAWSLPGAHRPGCSMFICSCLKFFLEQTWAQLNKYSFVWRQGCLEDRAWILKAERFVFQSWGLRDVPSQLALSLSLHEGALYLPCRVRVGVYERISPRTSSVTPDVWWDPLLLGAGLLWKHSCSYFSRILFPQSEQKLSLILSYVGAHQCQSYGRLPVQMNRGAHRGIHTKLKSVIHLAL